MENGMAVKKYGAAISGNNRSRRMKEDEFDQELRRLRETYGVEGRAAFRYEQDLALLFYRSGLTQEQLAQKEGVTQAHIAHRITFGKFLEFITECYSVKADATQENITECYNVEVETSSTIITDCYKAKDRLHGLNEGRFRALWRRTTKSETDTDARFREVIKMLAEDDEPQQKQPQRKLRKPIINRFGNGRWIDLETIANALNAEPSKVDSTLFAMSRTPDKFARVERRPHAATWQYRIFPINPNSSISIDEIRTKLRPIVETLKTEGKKHLASVVIRTCEQQAILLQRLIDGWTSGRGASSVAGSTASHHSTDESP